jgi:hypothetical protein
MAIFITKDPGCDPLPDPDPYGSRSAKLLFSFLYIKNCGLKCYLKHLDLGME